MLETLDVRLGQASASELGYDKSLVATPPGSSAVRPARFEAHATLDGCAVVVGRGPGRFSATAPGTALSSILGLAVTERPTTTAFPNVILDLPPTPPACARVAIEH